MKPVVSIIPLVLALVCAWPASAQQMPRIKDIKPGQYAYVIDAHLPGVPFKIPPMRCVLCVTAKDLDEGRALQAQRDAGMDCTYSNVTKKAGRFPFHASCKMLDGSITEADYEGHIAGDVVTNKVNLKTLGGEMPDFMRETNMKMVITRQGDC